MTKKMFILSAAVSATMAAPTASAINGHYSPGNGGLANAPTPPADLYYRSFLIHYDINSFNDRSGDKVSGNNGGSVNALAHRFIWMTGDKLLGADYGVEAIVPMIDVDLDLPGNASFDDRGVGDIYLSPVILGWHGKQWDVSFAAGQWFDTGDYDRTNPASVGNGYSTTMLTLGGMWSFDEAKRWNISALSRYETKSEQDETGITPGDSWLVEWGIGHRLENGLQLGLVGYNAWQLESDEGAQTQDKAERHALGAEAVYSWRSIGLTVKGAVYQEYASEAGGMSPLESEGDTYRLQITKAL